MGVVRGDTCIDGEVQFQCFPNGCSGFLVGGVCDSSVLCPDECSEPPENDNCADALPISDGCTAFSNCSARTDGPANQPNEGPTCFVSSDPYVNADIWYIYTATCTGDVTVSTCEGGSDTIDFDTKLAAYNTTDCGHLTDNDMTLLACNDDAGCGVSGHRAEVTVPVVSGQMYLIGVGKFNDSRSGMANLCIACGGFGPGTEACGEAQQACLDAVDALGDPHNKGLRRGLVPMPQMNSQLTRNVTPVLRVR